MCASSSDDLYAFDEGLRGVDSEESLYDTEEFYLDFDLESTQMGIDAESLLPLVNHLKSITKIICFLCVLKKLMKSL